MDEWKNDKTKGEETEWVRKNVLENERGLAFGGGVVGRDENSRTVVVVLEAATAARAPPQQDSIGW